MLREFFKPKFLIPLLLCAPVSAFSQAQTKNLGKAEFKKIIDLHWQNTPSRFDHASNEIRSAALKIEKFSEVPVYDYTAYGAQASVIVNSDIRDINTYYLRKDAYLNLRIPTFKSVNIIETNQTPDSINVLVDLIIKAPGKEINVRDRITFEKFDKYSWLRWGQEDDKSLLLWNRGFMILEPMGPGRVIATVYAVHVLQQSEALNFFKSPIAWSFTIDHYTNFIKSLQLAVSNKFVY